MHEDGDAAALRVEVADYIEREAMNQEEPGSWLVEAANLRDNQWATHTAICGYALMRSRQVVVHKLDAKTRAHSTISLLDQVGDTLDQETIHVWYNGVNHYDGMVHSSSATPQPMQVSGSTVYGDDFPPLSTSPKKRQRRFVMEPSRTSAAPKTSMASDQHDVPDDAAREAVHK
eukprot:6457845-Amphidinium_carterae.1